MILPKFGLRSLYNYADDNIIGISYSYVSILKSWLEKYIEIAIEWFEKIIYKQTPQNCRQW